MLKYWCVPFYYSEGYGLGDVTSDEDDDKNSTSATKKQLSVLNSNTVNSLSRNNHDTSTNTTTSNINNTHNVIGNNINNNSNNNNNNNTNINNNSGSKSFNRNLNRRQTFLVSKSTVNTTGSSPENSSSSKELLLITNRKSNYNSFQTNGNASETVTAATSTIQNTSNKNSIKNHTQAYLNTITSPSSSNKFNSSSIMSSMNSNTSTNSNNNNSSNQSSTTTVNFKNSSILNNKNINGNINGTTTANINTPITGSDCQNNIISENNQNNNNNNSTINNSNKNNNKNDLQNSSSSTCFSISSSSNSSTTTANNNSNKNKEVSIQIQETEISTINNNTINTVNNNSSSLSSSTNSNTTTSIPANITITDTSSTNNNNNNDNSIVNNQVNEKSRQSNSRLKRMIRTTSKSHSPSKSYDEDRRKAYLNSLSILNKSYGQQGSEEQQQQQQQDSKKTNRASKKGKQFAISFDTYKRALAQRLSKEKAIELDEPSLFLQPPSPLPNTQIYLPVSLTNSNTNINNIFNTTPTCFNTNNINNSPSNNIINNNNTNLNSTAIKNSGSNSNLLSVKGINRSNTLSAPNSTSASPNLARKGTTELKKAFSRESSFSENQLVQMSNNTNGAVSVNGANAASTSSLVGRVCMRVLYDSNTHVLTVAIIQSNKVLSAEKQKLFSKIQFHITLANKEKSPKYKTTTKEYSDFINFNESFYFPNIDKNELSSYSIAMSLFGKETFGSDKLISQSLYSLNTLNLNDQFNYITLYFEEIKKPNIEINNSSVESPTNALSSFSQDRPELLIGLKYDALLGNLFVSVIKGNHIFDRASPDKSPNTFVRVVLQVEKSEVKYQTALKKSSSTPTFDESFEFSLATYQVENAKLFIYIYSKRLLSSKNLIGCIIFDDQPGHENCVEHLKEAITSDGESVQRWHSLIFY